MSHEIVLFINFLFWPFLLLLLFLYTLSGALMSLHSMLL